MKVNFTCIIPTIGRACLRTALDSIAAQDLRKNDQIIVVSDTLSRSQPETKRIVKKYGEPFEYHEFAGTQHFYGMEQRTYGLKLAREGNYLTWIDDTDFYMTEAWKVMRERIAETQETLPHVFGFVAAWGVVPGANIAEGLIGSHNFVTPNVKGMVGSWMKNGGYRYQSDFDFIVSTLALWKNRIMWHNEFISDARGGYAGQVVNA